MRLISYLLLTSCWCSHWAKGEFSGHPDDDGQLVTDFNPDRSSSERQFINSVKKWLLGSGDEKKSKQTQIKYLPVYIPVPVYSDMKAPAASDFYGAYQFKPGESPMIQVPNVATLPYAHSHKYELPYTGQLHRDGVPFDFNLHSDQARRQAEADILNQHYYQQVLRNPYAYGGYNFPHVSSYAPMPVYYDDEEVVQEPEETDSVVVENHSLGNETTLKNDEEAYVRNRKKVAKKNRKGGGKFTL